MTYGIIDVGSNTIRLNLYQYEQEKLSLLLSKKYNAGLAGHVNGGSLTPRGIQLAIDTLNACRDICENFRVEHVSVFATASLRNIVNTDEVIRILRAKTGYSVDLISGEEEARLDFLGATHALNIQDGVLVDIGGLTYLTRGATFSYYEFVRPLDERLTDEEWQQMLRDGKAPDVPEWIRPYLLKQLPVVNEGFFYSSGC